VPIKKLQVPPERLLVGARAAERLVAPEAAENPIARDLPLKRVHVRVPPG